MSEQANSILARVSHDLSQLEKRDWELWIIVSFTGVIVGGGLLAILFPAAFLKGDNIHFELIVSRQLVVGLIARPGCTVEVVCWFDSSRAHQKSTTYEIPGKDPIDYSSGTKWTVW